MKIAVFGDSYAASHDHGIGRPWHQYLNDQYPTVSYGVNGSSLHYSYNEFLKHHGKFEKIVFLVTGPGRILLPLPEEYMNCDPPLQHVNGYHGIRDVVESQYKSNAYLNKVNNAVEDYYKYIACPERDLLFHKLLIKEIRNIRPDALLIPCFYVTGEEGWNSTFTLGHISQMDIDYYNLKSDKWPWADIRHCHLNQENNLIFSSMIADWVRTGNMFFDTKKFVNPTKPVTSYFNMTIYNS